MSTSQSIPTRLINVMAKTFALAAGEIGEDATSETLESWDSLAHQNLLLALSEEFGVTFSAGEGDGLQDYISLREALFRKLGEDGMGTGGVKPPTSASAVSAASGLAAGPDPVPVLVLGDSNTRTFAYHSAFLPVTISQGAKANLLTAKSRAFVNERIDQVLRATDASLPILLSLPGTFMHHFRNTYGTQAVSGPDKAALDDAFVAFAIGEYVGLALRIRGQGRRVAIAAVPPVRSADYRANAKAFNALLAERCHLENVPFIDVFVQVLGEHEEVKAEFWGDTWHLAPSASRLHREALEGIGFLKPGQGAAAAWTYRYFIPTQTAPIDVWGDFAEGDLSLTAPDVDFDLLAAGVTHSESFRWDRYHLRTNFIEDCMTSLCAALSLSWAPDGTCGVLVLDCREGLAAFLWNVPGTSCITGLDHDPLRIAMARRLAPFYGTNFTFNVVGRYGDGIGRADVVIALERAGFTDEYCALLFKTVRDACKVFAFLSDAPSAHIGLMERAGFAHVIELPITPPDGAVHLPQKRKVTKQLRGESTGYHLLVAFAENIGNEFREALATHVKSQWKQQAELTAVHLNGHFEGILDRVTSAGSRK